MRDGAAASLPAPEMNREQRDGQGGKAPGEPDEGATERQGPRAGDENPKSELERNRDGLSGGRRTSNAAHCSSGPQPSLASAVSSLPVSSAADGALPFSPSLISPSDVYFVPSPSLANFLRKSLERLEKSSPSVRRSKELKEACGAALEALDALMSRRERGRQAEGREAAEHATGEICDVCQETGDGRVGVSEAQRPEGVAPEREADGPQVEGAKTEKISLEEEGREGREENDGTRREAGEDREADGKEEREGKDEKDGKDERGGKERKGSPRPVSSFFAFSLGLGSGRAKKEKSGKQESEKKRELTLRGVDEDERDIELLFEPLRLACESNHPKLQLPALDGIHRLLVSGFISPFLKSPSSSRESLFSWRQRGDSEKPREGPSEDLPALSPHFEAETPSTSVPALFPSFFGSRKSDPALAPEDSPHPTHSRKPTEHKLASSSSSSSASLPLLSRVVVAVCRCSSSPDEAVVLQVLRCLLTTLTSPSLEVHGGTLLTCLRTLFDVFQSPQRSKENQRTAQAALLQTVHTVVQRYEFSAYPPLCAEKETEREAGEEPRERAQREPRVPDSAREERRPEREKREEEKGEKARGAAEKLDASRGGDVGEGQRGGQPGVGETGERSRLGPRNESETPTREDEKAASVSKFLQSYTYQLIDQAILRAALQAQPEQDQYSRSSSSSSPSSSSLSSPASSPTPSPSSSHPDGSSSAVKDDALTALELASTVNERGEERGRYGWCVECRQAAAHYCLETGDPVCGKACKGANLRRLRRLQGESCAESPPEDAHAQPVSPSLASSSRPLGDGALPASFAAAGAAASALQTESPLSPRSLCAAPMSVQQRDVLLVLQALCRLASSDDASPFSLSSDNEAKRGFGVFGLVPSGALTLGGAEGDRRPEEKRRRATTRLALELTYTMLHASGECLRGSKLFLTFVKRQLFFALIKSVIVPSLSSVSLRIFLYLVEHHHMHLEQETAFFLSDVLLRLVASPNLPLEQREAVLAALREFLAVVPPPFFLSLFVNFDCSVHEKDVALPLLQTLCDLAANGGQTEASTASTFQRHLPLREEAMRGLEALLSRLLAWIDKLNKKRAEARRLVRGRTRGSWRRERKNWREKKGGDLGEESDETLPLSSSDDSTFSTPPSRACSRQASVGRVDSSSFSKPEQGSSDLHDASHASFLRPPASVSSRLDQVVRQRERKNQIRRGVALFNRSPEKGLAHLVSLKYLEAQPKSVANFFLAQEGLSKTRIGEFLGEDAPFNKKVLHALVDSLDFRGKEIDAALKTFLQLFRLPGEAQKIDRMMEKFAEKFFLDNSAPSPAASALQKLHASQPATAARVSASAAREAVAERNARLYASADCCYVLAFSLIMLHTDAHSREIKEEQRMSKDAFVRNNRGINNGRDLETSYLETLYDRIVQEEWRLEDDDVALCMREKREKLPGSKRTRENREAGEGHGGERRLDGDDFEDLSEDEGTMGVLAQPSPFCDASVSSLFWSPVQVLEEDRVRAEAEAHPPRAGDASRAAPSASSSLWASPGFEEGMAIASAAAGEPALWESFRGLALGTEGTVSVSKKIFCTSSLQLAPPVVDLKSFSKKACQSLVARVAGRRDSQHRAPGGSVAQGKAREGKRTSAPVSAALSSVELMASTPYLLQLASWHLLRCFAEVLGRDAKDEAREEALAAAAVGAFNSATRLCMRLQLAIQRNAFVTALSALTYLHCSAARLLRGKNLALIRLLLALGLECGETLEEAWLPLLHAASQVDFLHVVAHDVLQRAREKQMLLNASLQTPAQPAGGLTEACSPDPPEAPHAPSQGARDAANSAADGAESPRSTALPTAHAADFLANAWSPARAPGAEPRRADEALSGTRREEPGADEMETSGRGDTGEGRGERGDGREGWFDSDGKDGKRPAATSAGADFDAIASRNLSLPHGPILHTSPVETPSTQALPGLSSACVGPRLLSPADLSRPHAPLPLSVASGEDGSARTNFVVSASAPSAFLGVALLGVGDRSGALRPLWRDARGRGVSGKDRGDAGSFAASLLPSAVPPSAAYGLGHANYAPNLSSLSASFVSPFGPAAPPPLGLWLGPLRAGGSPQWVSFASLSSSGGSETLFQNALVVWREVASSVLDLLFTQSRALSSAAVIFFVLSLCLVSSQELHPSLASSQPEGTYAASAPPQAYVFAPFSNGKRARRGEAKQAGDAPLLDTSPRLFSLQKLVEVAHFNMDRLRFVWNRIWTILRSHFAHACLHPSLAVRLYAIDSLRQLTTKFLEKDELAQFTFQAEFLKLFLTVMTHPHTEDEVKDFLMHIIFNLVRSQASNIRSGWRTVLQTVHAAATESSAYLQHFPSHRKDALASGSSASSVPSPGDGKASGREEEGSAQGSKVVGMWKRLRLAFQVVEQILAHSLGMLTGDSLDEAVRCLLLFASNPVDESMAIRAVLYLELSVLCLIEGTVPASFPGAALLASLPNEETRNSVVLSSLLHLHGRLRDGRRDKRNRDSRSLRETGEKRKNRVRERTEHARLRHRQDEAGELDVKDDPATVDAGELGDNSQTPSAPALPNNNATFFLCFPVLTALAHLACAPLPSSSVSSSSPSSSSSSSSSLAPPGVGQRRSSPPPTSLQPAIGSDVSSSSERRESGREGRRRNVALDALFRLLLTYGASFSPLFAFCVAKDREGSFACADAGSEERTRLSAARGEVEETGDGEGGGENEEEGKGRGEPGNTEQQIDRQGADRSSSSSERELTTPRGESASGDKRLDAEEEKQHEESNGCLSFSREDSALEERRSATEGLDSRWRMIFQGVLCPLFDDLFLLLRLNLQDRRAVCALPPLLPSSGRASSASSQARSAALPRDPAPENETERPREERETLKLLTAETLFEKSREAPSSNGSPREKPLASSFSLEDRADEAGAHASHPDSAPGHPIAPASRQKPNARASISSACSSASSAASKPSERRCSKEGEQERRGSDAGGGGSRDRDRHERDACAGARLGTALWAEMSCWDALRQLVLLADLHLCELQSQLKNVLSLIFAAVEEDSALERLARLGVEAFRNLLVALGRRTARPPRVARPERKEEREKPDAEAAHKEGEAKEPQEERSETESMAGRMEEEQKEQEDATEDVDLEACWRAVADSALALFQRTTPTSLLGDSFWFSSKDLLLHYGMFFLPVPVSLPLERSALSGDGRETHSETRKRHEEEDSTAPTENLNPHVCPEEHVQKQTVSSSSSSSSGPDPVEFAEDGFWPNSAGGAFPSLQREAIVRVLVAHSSLDVSSLFASFPFSAALSLSSGEERDSGDTGTGARRSSGVDSDTREKDERGGQATDTERNPASPFSPSRLGGSPGLAFDSSHVVTHCVVQLLLIDVLQQVVGTLAPRLPAPVLARFLCALESSFLFANIFNQQVEFRHVLQQRGFMSGMRHLPGLHKQSREAVSASLSLLTSVLASPGKSSSAPAGASSVLLSASEASARGPGRSRSMSAAEAAERFLRVSRWLVCQFLSREKDVAKLAEEKRLKETLARQQPSHLSRDGKTGWAEKTKSETLKHLELTESERELAGFAPLICGKMLPGLSRFPKETLSLYADAVFSLLVELIGAGSAEVRSAVRDFFASRFASMANLSFCSPMVQRQTLLATSLSSSSSAASLSQPSAELVQQAADRRSSKASQAPPVRAALSSPASSPSSPAFSADLSSLGTGGRAGEEVRGGDAAASHLSAQAVSQERS
ncbi:Sec7 domain containing protein, related [Neospora caninum Liverpool]|uniref:Sec7 domain containing protein, related n=1 Tax=Neospora caninum (strain Liverpool) TaxID=572307 RepID=F0VK14_NEOCL|nr:Sec7 domain containing protein, related [Neospora caninum Liverpool]CBZ54059.1 Sec7 domain containing protein, related [Neospora caninum Liverpool]CEL68755.1 TPA: Sec7 domain containing protein, related [Neospora caninum Liverpool]|eukprot:XP_003884090.1 Sec7 domain containing protein, related [Neospora caninum Liverpool]